MPWKNGHGSTTELAVEPPGAALDDFDWRISIAELRGSGPFSTFPGYDRIIVQLDGPPMTLTHGGAGPIVLERLVPHAFSGDDATMCTVAGIAHDFNLIVRRGAARAKLTVHRPDEGAFFDCKPVVGAVLHVLAGQVSGASCSPPLSAGDTHIHGPGERARYRSGRDTSLAYVTFE